MLKIREYRKARGMTQKELADEVGVLNVSLSNYERGSQMPDINTLAKIANVLEVSVDTLIGLDETIEDSSPKTLEARILADGVDKLPREQREQALNVVRAMFANYADYFEGRERKDATEP